MCCTDTQTGEYSYTNVRMWILLQYHVSLLMVGGVVMYCICFRLDKRSSSCHGSVDHKHLRAIKCSLHNYTNDVYR